MWEEGAPFSMLQEYLKITQAEHFLNSCCHIVLYKGHNGANLDTLKLFT